MLDAELGPSFIGLPMQSMLHRRSGRPEARGVVRGVAGFIVAILAGYAPYAGAQRLDADYIVSCGQTVGQQSFVQFSLNPVTPPPLNCHGTFFFDPVTSVTDAASMASRMSLTDFG